MSVTWDGDGRRRRIARAHGLRGQVIVDPETDFLQEAVPRAGRAVRAACWDGRAVDADERALSGGRPVVGIVGIESMSEAEPLAGLELRIPIERLVALPEGTFYRHDLVGCRVETRAGRSIGVVREVEGTLAGQPPRR